MFRVVSLYSGFPFRIWMLIGFKDFARSSATSASQGLCNKGSYLSRESARSCLDLRGGAAGAWACGLEQGVHLGLELLGCTVLPIWPHLKQRPGYFSPFPVLPAVKNRVHCAYIVWDFYNLIQPQPFCQSTTQGPLPPGGRS